MEWTKLQAATILIIPSYRSCPIQVICAQDHVGKDWLHAKFFGADTGMVFAEWELIFTVERLLIVLFYLN